MAEADELCDRIAVIARRPDPGAGHPRRAAHHADGRRVLEVEAYGVTDGQLAAIRRLPGRTRGEPGRCRRGAAAQRAVRRGGGRAGRRAARSWTGSGWAGSTARQPTLEDAYVAIVNRAAAPTPVAGGGAGMSTAADDRGRRAAARQAAQPLAVRDRHRADRPGGAGDPGGLPVPGRRRAAPAAGGGGRRGPDGRLVVGAVRLRRRDPEPALAGHPGDDHVGAPAAGAGAAAGHPGHRPARARTPCSPPWSGAGCSTASRSTSPTRCCSRSRCPAASSAWACSACCWPPPSC